MTEKIRASVIREEYECGNYCTVNGCGGHDGRVIGLDINGFEFCDMESYTGDWPQEAKQIEEVIKKAVEILNRKHND
jgi:hypothetical protein